MVSIVPRTDTHMPGCAELARTTHRIDGYPIVLQADSFVATHCALGAWVALSGAGVAGAGVAGAEVVGHVALHDRTSEAVAELLNTSGVVDPARVGVVSRLMVSPDARGRGLGAALLETAAQAARDRHLRPVLDVVTRQRSAIRLYQRAGWERVGAVSVGLPNGEIVDEYVFLGPTVPIVRPIN